MPGFGLGGAPTVLAAASEGNETLPMPLGPHPVSAPKMMLKPTNLPTFHRPMVLGNFPRVMSDALLLSPVSEFRPTLGSHTCHMKVIL